VTRFSDIANFVTMTLMFTIFPFTAELAAKGKDTRPLMLKAAAAIVGTSAALAVLFWAFGHQILTFLPNGVQYADYYWAIPWMIAIGTLSSLSSLYGSVEVSANRFGYMWWSIPLTTIYPLALLTVTGNGYFINYLPAGMASFIRCINVTSLESMFWWMTAFQVIRLVFSVVDCCLRHKAETIS